MKQLWLRPIPLLGLLTLIFASVILWRAASPPSPAFATLPTPNGFDLLTEAANSLPTSPELSNPTDLARFLASHQTSLTLLEKALSHQTEVPMALFDPTTNPGDALGKMKLLTQTLLTKGKFQEQAQDFSGALTTYLTTIKLGQSLEHGPLMAFLVGVSIEKKGLTELRRLYPTLSPSQQSQLSQEISHLNASRLPWNGVLTREEYFMRTHASNPLMFIYARFFWKGSKAGFQNGQNRHQEIQQAFRTFPQ